MPTQSCYSHTKWSETEAHILRIVAMFNKTDLITFEMVALKTGTPSVTTCNFLVIWQFQRMFGALQLQ